MSTFLVKLVNHINKENFEVDTNATWAPLKLKLLRGDETILFTGPLNIREVLERICLFTDFSSLVRLGCVNTWWRKVSQSNKIFSEFIKYDSLLGIPVFGLSEELPSIKQYLISAIKNAKEIQRCWTNLEYSKLNFRLMLRPGTQKNKILECESKLGRNFPSDIRYSALIHDGYVTRERHCIFFYGCSLLVVDEFYSLQTWSSLGEPITVLVVGSHHEKKLGICYSTGQVFLIRSLSINLVASRWMYCLMAG
jgi:hypothetical protein